MFSKKVFINSSDVDISKTLSIPALFRLFQDVAVEGVEASGLGEKVNTNLNLIWVFTRMYVKCYRMPKYQENIIVKTYPGRRLRFIYPRYFEITSLDGKILVRASSTWCLLDKDSRQIFFDNDNIYNLEEEHLEGELELPQKINENQETELKETYIVPYTDCDLNRHMNNIAYINRIVNLKDGDFYDKNYIETLLINYEKEIKEKSIINILTSKDGEYIVGEVERNISFKALIKYANK